MSPMNANPQELATDAPLGELEPVAYFDGAMLTGVTVSRGGRIFVTTTRRTTLERGADV